LTRCANADDFVHRLRAIRSEYEALHRLRIQALRAKLDAKDALQVAVEDQALEEHRREYVVDGVLEALNWRMGTSRDDGPSNLVPEVSVRSAHTGRSIRMDYLGLDSNTECPLMIVETKSPRDGLPELKSGTASTYSGVFARALGGAELKGSWTTWLNKLADYVRSTTQRATAPVRVVMTNGDWYVIFLNPGAVFAAVAIDDVDLSSIVVFESLEEFEARAADVFQHLEHSRVLGHTPPLRAEELPFIAGDSAVARITHGLLLKYSTTARVFDSIPSIFVAPVIFIRFTVGAWFCVRAGPRDFAIPTKASELGDHLCEVEKAAKQLLEEVSYHLRCNLAPLPLATFYAEELESGASRGVRERAAGVFELVTGEGTHYLKSAPSVRNCEWHSFGAAHKAGCSHSGAAILLRSLEPRSFFVSDEQHHCAHSSVRNAKGSPVDDVNRPLCGPRSSASGGAFCEIWRFETHLCCRACVYEPVCTKAQVLRLPCTRPSG
jgi:hypothetical protein